MTRISSTLLLILLISNPTDAQVLLSEVRVDQPSADNDEYFELSGPPSTSLNSLTYLIIGDDAAGASGVIEGVVDLAGQSIGVTGYFVAAEATFTLGTADLTVNLDFENKDNTTHILVSGFSGAMSDDLDTNDDCVLDTLPWTSVVDGAAIIEEVNPPSGTECHYGTDLGLSVVGPDGGLVPGHVYRDGSVSTQWNVGIFNTVGGDDTPGAPNGSLPVELVDFSVALNKTEALLSWTTASEANNAGFEVQHAVGNRTFAAVDFVSGSGTTSGSTNYNYTVANVGPGLHRFRLRQVDLDGAFDYSPIVEMLADLVVTHDLSNGYPNPFTEATRFSLIISETEHVQVDAYDIVGRRVAVLHHGILPRLEPVEFSLAGAELPSGLYQVRVTGESFRDARTVVLAK